MRFLRGVSGSGRTEVCLFRNLSYGLPCMISLEDCDRLYPSVHDTAPGDDADAVDTSKKPYLANHSMLSLTILLGKVMKLLYSATGILNVTDQQLEQVELELDQYVNTPASSWAVIACSFGRLRLMSPSVASHAAGTNPSRTSFSSLVRILHLMPASYTSAPFPFRSSCAARSSAFRTISGGRPPC